MAATPQDNGPIEIRFRATPTSHWRGWVSTLTVCALLGCGAGLAAWQYGQTVLVADLEERIRRASHPADALMAIDAALQLDGTGTAIVAEGLLHSDPAVAQAAADGLAAKTQEWRRLAPSLARTRLRSVAERLAAIAVDLPADSIPHAELLASQILAVVRTEWDSPSPEIEALCQRLLVGVGADPLSAAGGTGPSEPASTSP